MFTATPEQLDALLELQRRDTRALILRESLAGLQQEPELVTALKRRQAAVARAKELEARRRRLEGERDQARQRLDGLLERLEKDRARRDAGGTSKAVSALQRQIESLTTQIEKARAGRGAAEEALSGFLAERAELMPRLKAADARARELAARAEESGRQQQAELQQLQGEREGIVSGVGQPQLVARYERIRAAGGHRERTAVARRNGAACGACGSSMSPAELVAVEADPSALVTCGDCGAILVS